MKKSSFTQSSLRPRRPMNIFHHPQLIYINALLRASERGDKGLNLLNTKVKVLVLFG